MSPVDCEATARRGEPEPGVPVARPAPTHLRCVAVGRPVAVTFIVEKKFRYAAIASFAGAVLSFIGLISAPEVAWAGNPHVALGYLFFGIVCVAHSFLPAAKDPADIDEADIVAGH
jgi:hypothetical protein